MADQRSDSPEQILGLAKGFRAWWAPPENIEPFIRTGQIVLDANVLLHLYRVTPTAREQILATLLEVQGRIWIPHQAAVEFHRNRTSVVRARLGTFREVRQSLKQATNKAVAEIRKAVVRFRALQQSSMTETDWDPDANGLDEASILKRIDGVMDGALAELARIEAEHDLGPDDIRRDDPVLLRLEEITKGRVGRPYSTERLQSLVEEAILYRFPNEIPPGYMDADSKGNPYRAAGDYILWRQVLDHANALAREQFLILVTNDAKEDWWILDSKGRPESGRPELRQELFDCSGAAMAQMMLSNFLEQAAQYYPDQISPETVVQVRESELAVQIDAEISANSVDSKLDLMNLSPSTLEHLVRQLLEAMGYEAFITRASGDSGFDIDATRPTSGSGSERTLVDVKRYGSVVSPQTVRALYGTLQAESADHAMIITTSWFTSSSKVFAQDKNLTLVEGSELLALLREYLGIEAVISERRIRPTGEMLI